MGQTCIFESDVMTMLNTKWMRFPIDVILVCIRLYAAYPLSDRHLEEMMQERDVVVDHSSINRWAIRFLPLLEKTFRKHKRPVGKSWRMDETYLKVKGAWKYLYRAVDREGKSDDFLLSTKRNASAAKGFFDKAMQHNEAPETVTMDKSGANKAVLDQLNAEPDLLIKQDPASQVSQQYRRAGPSRRQTGHPADARV